MPKKKITKIAPKGTLISRVVVVKRNKGDDGYTPVKGVDYFDGKDGRAPTEEELLSLIIPRIPEPIPGKPGKDVPVEKVKKLIEEVVGTIEFPTIDIGEDQRGQWVEKDGKKTYIKSVSNIGAGMSTGVVDFTALRDAPHSYVGQASKVVKVKADETGLEFLAGGGGAVDSVNGQTGVVVLDTGDIAEATDLNYVSDAQLVVIGNTSGTNTGDQTFIDPRVVTTTDDATAVIDCTVTDQYQLTAIANATTFTVTGTPVNGRSIIIRLKDAGVAKALTWDSVFRAIGVTLPTTTVANKTHYIGVKYNSADSKWDVLAVGVEA